MKMLSADCSGPNVLNVEIALHTNHYILTTEVFGLYDTATQLLMVAGSKQNKCSANSAAKAIGYLSS